MFPVPQGSHEFFRDRLEPLRVPLPISSVVSTETMKVIRVNLLPTGADNTIKPVEKYKIQPPNEYIPEAQILRTDLKPLQVVQPEGASFQSSRARHIERDFVVENGTSGLASTSARVWLCTMSDTTTVVSSTG
jgi:hypothetical protein